MELFLSVLTSIRARPTFMKRWEYNMTNKTSLLIAYDRGCIILERKAMYILSYTKKMPRKFFDSLDKEVCYLSFFFTE